MRVDRGALAAALGIEAVLATAAVFGGPHGVLGASGWMLNLPGILVLFGIDSDRFFLPRAVLAAAIQVFVWYGLLAYLRRRRRGGGAQDETAPRRAP